MTDIKIPARVDYSSQPVLTTEQLAEFYGCKPQQIIQNFNNNKEHFEEGVHYFKLEGAVLKDFKSHIENFDTPINKFASVLYLWTKRGAARHAKMLGTPRAWEVYGELEEHYFSGNTGGVPMTNEQIEKLLLNPDAIITICRNWQKDREAKERLLVENGELKLENATLKTENAELQPQATYCKMILNCKDVVSTTTIAKDYGMSAKQLNRLLHEFGVQFKQSGIWFPYQQYASLGWTQTKTHNYINDGDVHAKVHMYWTQEGRLGLYELLKQKGYLPLIEQHEREDEETPDNAEQLLWV